MEIPNEQARHDNNLNRDMSELGNHPVKSNPAPSAMWHAANATSESARQPRVTVFIPAFNVERYISDAIRSVLAQTFTDFELLVIDDGSTDATSAVICSFAHDSRLRAVSHIQNLGRPATRNHGIDLACGEYIAFLDADDMCAANRLERQVSYLDASGDVAGVGSWMNSIDTNGNPLVGQTYQLPTAPDDIACRMLYECALAQSSMTVRRSAFENYRYVDEFWIAQDYELWARMIRTLRFANLAALLTDYRRHEAQVSVTQTAAQQAADLAIYSRQLAALDLEHSDHDLLRHGCLFKCHGRKPVLEHTGRPFDTNYLRWCRIWLEKLLHANERHQISPEPAFSNMIVHRWLFACRKAARTSSWLTVAVEFSKSSLSLRVTTYHWNKSKTAARPAP
ncbi:glycosyltransferase family A protein [Salinisphaera sp. S4-8]|uniref:glycosyltransferase family 2 protein n=1 Tax=Salinisphaera sp. S4-8 TaxID=633357 RepID=UPI00333EDD73